ncbi:MAG: beta-lactamase family protein [Sphingomonadaceae bacterium]|nr:beta-lactamase family protein [Sphingomonadaceae bacterium]
MRTERVPGLVWGIVNREGAVHLEAMGLADVATGRPVTIDTAFRIASMTKAFTARVVLELAAEGRLDLDDPAVRYVPELGRWAPDVTVADLLHHTAGFVTDDPWADRQQPLPEAEFTRLLAAGVPFNRPPGTAHEYSNLGYAILGRILTNLEGRPYQDEIAQRILRPLGMDSTTFEVRAVPADRLARGYRFEDGRWVEEPMMGDGAFGAMGGLVTTARDYARWMAWLLQGLPGDPTRPRSADVRRRMAEGRGFVVRRPRPGRDAPSCEHALIYAGGLRAGDDCLLGRFLMHSGGYPGYGAHMVLWPEAGVGLFAFANRTYAAPVAPVWDAAGELKRRGFLNAAPLSVSPALAQAMTAVRRIWGQGRIDAEPARLAPNMPLDRSPSAWAAELARLKRELGPCEVNAPPTPTGALSGRFEWPCRFGILAGEVLLAPTPEPEIQALRLAIARP